MAEEEVGSLRVGLSMDSAKFEQSLASVDRNIKALGQDMAIVRAKGKEWGDSTEGLTVKQKTLSTMLESQDVKVRKLNEAHQKAVLEQGANSKAAENLAIKIKKATAELIRTETELSQVNSDLKKQQTELKSTSNKWDELSASVDETGDKLKATGDKMKEVGSTLTAGVTAPILAAGASVGIVANQFDAAQGKIQAQLGLTAEEAEKLGTVAKGVWENAFGESLTEVSDSLAIIKQNLKGLSDTELQEFAEGAYTIRDAFGAEINETTRTASVLMKNFGVNGITALDLITTGFQRGGNYSDELLDTLREYAPQFKGMGYNAEEFTAILIAGAESGAFNLDKVGDAAKEAFLRIGDGSKTSRDALGAVGLDFKQIEKDINSGGETAKTSFAAVASAIAGIKDPAKKAQTAVALLGTPIEDLGPEFQTFFATVNTDLGDFEGATKKAGTALYDNFGSRIQSEFREFQSSLEPAGEILLDIAEDWLPRLANASEDALEWFMALGPEGQKTALSIAGIAAAAGPAAIVIGNLTTGVGGLIKVVSPLVTIVGKAGLAGSLAALINPVGLAIAGVAALGVGIYAVSEATKGNTEETLNSIEARKKEIESTDALIERFGELRGKNKLSTDEVLRYMDIMSELKEAKTEETIKKLSAEQETLQKKSGMTNDEITEFLELNGNLVKEAPKTAQAISGQGNAYVEVLDKLKELNQLERERLTQDTYTAITEEMNLQKENLQKQAELQDVIAKKEKERDGHLAQSVEYGKKIEAQDLVIAGIQEDLSLASKEEAIAIAEKLSKERDIKTALIEQRDLHDFQKKQIDDEIKGKEVSLTKTEKELKLFEGLQGEYEALILSQAGITAEKGEGLTKTNEEISKLQSQRSEVEKLIKAGKGNTAEHQAQIGKIDTQISKLQIAKGEFEAINKVAQQTLHKDMYINEHPRDFWETLDENLSRPITKTVSIRYNNMNGPQDVGRYAQGTLGHPGGPAIVGDGVGNNAGRELIKLPNQKLFLSPAKPTLLNLPKGTSVLSAINTRKYLGRVPKYATGTKNTTSTPFELVNYDSRLKAVSDGSSVARIREIRNAEIASLETKIELLTKEGATIQQLNQAKEMETRLTKLQSDKAREYQNRIKEQKITIEVLNKAFKNKKITLSEYNSEVAKAQSEIHKLTAEQMAFNDALSKRQDIADSMKEDTNSQMQAYETVKEAQLKQLSNRNAKSEDLFKKETSLYIDELNRQKDAALNSFDAQTKAHEAAVNRQIENLKKKRDAELGAIDAQLAALEELEKVESREEVEAGFGTEKENLNRRLTIANFMGDEDTVKSVHSEIESLDKEIAKQRLNWQREDTRDALSLEKERIDQAYDLQEKELENSLVLWKAERDRERENLEAHYEMRTEQFALMREQQLENLALQHENNLVAAEREFEFQKERFTGLQEQLALHLENGTITQAQANAAWLQAMKDAGSEQVFQEIENQEKSKAALDTYVTAYLDMGKKYGNNLINGVVSTLNTRLSEVTAAAAKIRSAMSIDTSSTMQSAAFNTRAITQATPVTSIAPQLIHINMDGEEIASYALSHATGALRQVSRKG